MNTRAKLWLSAFLFLIIAFIAILMYLPHECGDIWDRSPAQLLSENEIVALAELQGVDTLLELGSYIYISSEARFAVVEYTFSVTHLFTAQRDIQDLYLWNNEYKYDKYRDFSTGLWRVSVGDTALIYGRILQENDSLPLVMSSMSSQSGLFAILRGEEPQLSWATRETDSLIAVRILNSEKMKRALQNRTDSNETILYCPEQFMLTTDDFHDDNLCYYDSSNIGHSVSSSEYLQDLIELTSD